MLRHVGRFRGALVRGACALSVAAALFGCRSGRKSPSGAVAETHAQLERQGEARAKAYSLEKATFDAVKFSVFRFQRVDGRGDVPSAQPSCILRYDVSPGVWGVVPQTTFDCDSEPEQKTVLGSAKARLLRLLSVPADDLESKLEMALWLLTATEQLIPAAVGDQVNKDGVDTEECIRAVVSRLAQDAMVRSSEQCSAFVAPGARVDEFRIRMNEALARARKASAPQDSADAGQTQGSPDAGPIDSFAEWVQTVKDEVLADAWRGSVDPEMQLACLNRIRYSNHEVARAAVVTRAVEMCIEAHSHSPGTAPSAPKIWQVPVLDKDPVRGAKDALVTIVEFGDYESSDCKVAEDTLSRIRGTYHDQVRIVWKDYPQSDHPQAKVSALLGRVILLIRGVDSFWSAHDALFAISPAMNDNAMRRVSDRFGISWEAVKTVGMESSFLKDDFDAIAKLASDIDVKTVPHFFVNGISLVGPQPYDRFKEVIDKQIALGRRATPHEWRDIPLPDESTAVKGGALPAVVIQEFADFQCPFSRRSTAVIAELQAAYGERLGVAWRHNPLPFHPQAFVAAEAAQEAFAQRGSVGFWSMHDRLFELQGGAGLEPPQLERAAQAIGLDMDQFRAALASHRHKPKVEADMQIAKEVNIGGTPSFVINGRLVNGAQPAAAFREVIDEALHEAEVSR
jgi:protein-disulfide isomerase